MIDCKIGEWPRSSPGMIPENLDELLDCGIIDLVYEYRREHIPSAIQKQKDVRKALETIAYVLKKNFTDEEMAKIKNGLDRCGLYVFRRKVFTKFEAATKERKKRVKKDCAMALKEAKSICGSKDTRYLYEEGLALYIFPEERRPYYLTDSADLANDLRGRLFEAQEKLRLRDEFKEETAGLFFDEMASDMDSEYIEGRKAEIKMQEEVKAVSRNLPTLCSRIKSSEGLTKKAKKKLLKTFKTPSSCKEALWQELALSGKLHDMAEGTPGSKLYALQVLERALGTIEPSKAKETLRKAIVKEKKAIRKQEAKARKEQDKMKRETGVSSLMWVTRDLLPELHEGIAVESDKEIAKNQESWYGSSVESYSYKSEHATEDYGNER